jgi:hypothetical protein
MLFETYNTVHRLMEYTPTPDRRWRARFVGAIEVTAEGASLEECRNRFNESLDRALAAWIANPTAGAAPDVAGEPSGVRDASSRSARSGDSRRRRRPHRSHPGL